VTCKSRFFYRPCDSKENGGIGEEKILVDCSLSGTDHVKCKYEIVCTWMYKHTRVVMR
jgi:hypothetical protein